MKIVKETHENGGGCGSIGYRYNWKEEEARKNVLRTHTTAISSQMLYKLGQECTSGQLSSSFVLFFFFSSFL